MLGVGYAHLGRLHLQRRRFTEALELLQQASRLWTVGKRNLLAEITCDIGSALRGLGDLPQALDKQRQALATMEKQRSAHGECHVRLELATTLQQAGQNDEAVDHLRKALDLAERLHLPAKRAAALDLLAVLTSGAQQNGASGSRS
jgi:tetratricopeptide (TPR) repeat protein